MTRDYFEQQEYEASIAERERFMDRLYQRELKTSELSRPVREYPSTERTEMSYSEKTPDEHGWYWVKYYDDRWFMAFVDTGREKAYFFDGSSRYANHDLEEVPEDAYTAWYGPFACPGGDFGAVTVVADEELHTKAKAERKAIGIQHFDYRYCVGESHGSSLTVSGLYDREDADRLIHREVSRCNAEVVAAGAKILMSHADLTTVVSCDDGMVRVSVEEEDGDRELQPMTFEEACAWALKWERKMVSQ